MKHWDLISGAGRIKRATQHLRQKWTETKTQWTDKAGHDFEQKYLQPLPAHITLTIAAIYKLKEVLDEAANELEDDREQ
jgi:hypothetical protein